MRKDMAKVLVERPRLIDSTEHRGRKLPDELLPKSLGVRRAVREAGGFKQLNENLAPLRRYLERQVGRPWNKVFSDIAANLKSTSTVQQHVRDHINDFVQLHPHADARVWAGSERRWFQALYVDPRDGILKRTDRLDWYKALAKPKAAAPVDRISVSADRELRRLDGLWFEVTLAPLPSPEYRTVLRPAAPSPAGKPREAAYRQLVTPAVVDAVSGKAVCAGPELDEERAWKAFREAHPSRTYAVSKRQLSRAEMRRHCLTNSAEDKSGSSHRGA
jgi:hypothetical protein